MKLLSDFMAVKSHPKKGRKGSLGTSRFVRPSAKKATQAAEPKGARAARLVKVEETPQVPRDTETVVAAPHIERNRYDGDSAIKLYLREIGQVPLLTIQEE